MGLWSWMFNPLEAAIQGESYLLIRFPILFLFKKEEPPSGERTPTLEVFWEASNWYHLLQLPGQLWPHWTQLARVKTVPFSTSFLLETIYWRFGLWKDENRSYCEIQMLFTGGGGLVTESCQTLCNPMDCSPPGSSVHGDSPGKNTGVVCHSLLQGIFPTQGSKLHLLHCRWILYCWATREAPRSKKWLKVNEPLLVNLTFSLGFVCIL